MSERAEKDDLPESGSNFVLDSKNESLNNSSESFPESSRIDLWNQENSEPIVVSRDPEDVRALQRRDIMILVLALSLSAVTGLCFYQMLRSPDLITAVVTENGRRVVSLNDRQFGETEAVQLGKDNLSNDDKKYLVSEFTRLRYQIDPASRGKDVEKFLRLMVGKSAVAYANKLKESQVLEVERAENWTSVWTPQSFKLDAADPNKIRVIGTQKITKILNGQASESTAQYEVTLKLTSDGTRSDANLRTGYQVVWLDEQIISQKTDGNIPNNS